MHSYEDIHGTIISYLELSGDILAAVEYFNYKGKLPPIKICVHCNKETLSILHRVNEVTYWDTFLDYTLWHYDTDSWYHNVNIVYISAYSNILKLSINMHGCQDIDISLLKNLTSLSMTGNIKFIRPQLISKKLICIIITNNSILTDEDLGHMSNIKYFHGTYNAKISYKGINQLKHIIVLNTDIDIRNCIKELKHLTHVRLPIFFNREPIEQDGIKSMFLMSSCIMDITMNNLTHLIIRCHHRIKELDISKLKNLKQLAIENSSDIIIKGLDSLKFLTRIYMSKELYTSMCNVYNFKKNKIVIKEYDGYFDKYEEDEIFINYTRMGIFKKTS
jgi:Leucine-rich repeat (LRR) protein